MRGRIALLGERVHRGLVVPDVAQIRIGPDLVESASQEQGVGRDADQVERGRRHEVHPVRRRRQVVLLIAPIFEVGVERLAGLLEIEHRIADFLHLAPERRLEPGRLDQHGPDARVDLRFAQALDERADSRRVDAAEIPEDVVGRHLGEVAAYLQDEGRVRRNPGLASVCEKQQRKAGNGNRRCEAEDREDDGKSTFSHV